MVLRAGWYVGRLLLLLKIWFADSLADLSRKREKILENATALRELYENELTYAGQIVVWNLMGLILHISSEL